MLLVVQPRNVSLSRSLAENERRVERRVGRRPPVGVARARELQWPRFIKSRVESRVIACAERMYNGPKDERATNARRIADALSQETPRARAAQSMQRETD